MKGQILLGLLNKLKPANVSITSCKRLRKNLLHPTKPFC